MCILFHLNGRRPDKGSAFFDQKRGSVGEDSKLGDGDLVRQAAARLRDLIFSAEPDTQIGALPEIARRFGVGIVTIQQAARVLEHEGLLKVRRGPGGGYYGARPDEGALERSTASYLKTHCSGFAEALEVIGLLDCELIPAAAACTSEELHNDAINLSARIGTSVTADHRMAFERDLHKLLFAM